jgi:hypothetical protein
VLPSQSLCKRGGEIGFRVASSSPVQTQQFLHISSRIDSNSFSNSPLGSPTCRCTTHPLVMHSTAYAHRAPHAAREPTSRALHCRGRSVASSSNQKRFSQLIGVELNGRVAGVGCFGVLFHASLRGREAHPHDPPAATCLTCAFDFGEGVTRT